MEVSTKVFILSSILEDIIIVAPKRIKITQINYRKIFYKTTNKFK